MGENKGFNEEQLKYLDKYLHDVEYIIFELAVAPELQKVALAQVRVLVGLYQQNNKQMF